MSINYEGYLSHEIEKIQQDILNKHGEYFELALNINKLCHTIKFELNVRSKHIQEVTAATLFVSLLESFDSVYILLSRGLVADSNVLLRSMLEKTLRLKYIALDYDNSIAYYKAYELQRLKLMNVVLNDKHGIYTEEVKKSISKRDLQELKKKINDERISDLPSNEELAKLTGLEMFYGYAYRLLNDYVHSNASLVERLLEAEEGEIKSLHWFAYFKDISDDIRTIAFSIMYLLLAGSESVLELFEIGKEEILNTQKELTNQLNSLAETHVAGRKKGTV